MKKVIIWDFNGTLLNDTNYCVEVMNTILNSRGYPLITVEIYKEIFGFPVKEYYQKAGFDLKKHNFYDLSNEFIKLYYEGIHHKASLHLNTHEVLSKFKSKGIQQYILSAMEHDSLVKLTKHFNINQYFEDVWGIDNHHAGGKVDLAKKYLTNIEADKLYYIGDTNHDVEVAKTINAKVFLHVNGSQSVARLKTIKSAKLIENLQELSNLSDFS